MDAAAKRLTLPLNPDSFHARHPLCCRRTFARSCWPRSDFARLDSHATRLEGRLQLSGNQRRLLLRQYPSAGRSQSAELRIGNQAALARLQRERHRLGEGVAGQGPGDRSPGHGRHRSRHGRRGYVSVAEERPLVRVPPHDRPPAAADEHLRRRRPGAELRVQFDPPVLPGTRLPLRPHADHHRQRLRRGRGDVPSDHARSGQRAETESTSRLPSNRDGAPQKAGKAAGRFLARFLQSPGVFDRQRAA